MATCPNGRHLELLCVSGHQAFTLSKKLAINVLLHKAVTELLEFGAQWIAAIPLVLTS